MQKYSVVCDGKTISLQDLADMCGLTYDTLLKRVHAGVPLLENPASWTMKREVEPPSCSEVGPGDRVGLFADAYTFNEVADLYKGFAGQPDELRILMDFTGLQRNTARKLLTKLRENAKKIEEESLKCRGR